MILGINPKNDYAFKRVFGNEQHPNILIDLLNAVLKPPPNERIVAVEILNPITDKGTLEEKLTILDVRAQDQKGRHFIVEMQMTVHPGFAERLLYYGAGRYSAQLQAGQNYDELQPVICICFLDGRLFRDTDRCHLYFGLIEHELAIRFSEHLQIHLFQLPNFLKTADQLEDDIEKWLFFLNNVDRVDVERLPVALEIPIVHEALEVLRMLTQDERERELYLDREKARRDALSFSGYWEKQKKNWEQQQRDFERQQMDWQQQQMDWQQQQMDWRQQQMDWRQQQMDWQQEKLNLEHKVDELVDSLVTQIRTLEQLLKQTPSPNEQLRNVPVEELQRKLSDLQQRLLDQNNIVD